MNGIKAAGKVYQSHSESGVREGGADPTARKRLGLTSMERRRWIGELDVAENVRLRRTDATLREMHGFTGFAERMALVTTGYQVALQDWAFEEPYPPACGERRSTNRRDEPGHRRCGRSHVERRLACQTGARAAARVQPSSHQPV